MAVRLGDRLRLRFFFTCGFLRRICHDDYQPCKSSQIFCPRQAPAKAKEQGAGVCWPASSPHGLGHVKQLCPSHANHVLAVARLIGVAFKITGVNIKINANHPAIKVWLQQTCGKEYEGKMWVRRIGGRAEVR